MTFTALFWNATYEHRQTSGIIRHIIMDFVLDIIIYMTKLYLFILKSWNIFALLQTAVKTSFREIQELAIYLTELDKLHKAYNCKMKFEELKKAGFVYVMYSICLIIDTI